VPLVPPDGTQARRNLETAITRLRSATLRRRNNAALVEGLRAIYRRARRRAPSPGSAPSSTSLHAWRRQTKRYGHLLGMFEPVNPKRLRPIREQVETLAELLGEDHDLALLDQRLRSRRAAPLPTDTLVLSTLAERRRRLQQKAVRLGAGVYAERSKVVARALLEDWQRKPRGRTTAR
jgi:CHAD domain-containing protein